MERFSAYYVPKIALFYLLWARGGSLWVYEQVWSRLLFSSKAIVPPKITDLIKVQEEANIVMEVCEETSKQVVMTLDEEYDQEETQQGEEEQEDLSDEEDAASEEETSGVTLTTTTTTLHRQKMSLSQFAVDCPPLFLPSERPEYDADVEEEGVAVAAD